VVTASVGTGAGTLGLNQSAAGAVSPTLAGTFTGEVYTTPSTVTAITCATACAQTAITTTVSWSVTFSRSVTGVSASAFSLVASGLTGSAITTVTGSGTSWVVTASVGTGAGTLGLNQSAAGSVSPALAGTFTGEVYTTPSTVTAITCATACTQTAITSTVSWNVTFNRSVTGVDASAFSLVASGLTGSAITTVTGSGTGWVVTASVGTGAGTLGLNQSAAGAVSPTLAGAFTGEVYTTPGTVVTAIACATACTQTAVTTTVSWNITFNRSVTSVTSAAFGLVASGLTGSAITTVTGSGTSWVVTANVGAGAGTLGLNQTGAGTVSPTLSGTFSGQVYTTPPTVVTAITCASTCTQATTASSVSWNVTFNRSVTGVSSSAFALASSGLTGAFLATVTGSGTAWTVTANLGVGSGTLGLNQTGAGAVSPTLTGTFTGQVYTLLTASSLAIYKFDETSWNGAVAQVLDSSGNGNHAQAINGATTAITNPAPAIPESPGTCRYGVMTSSSVTNGNVKTPLPNLTTDFTAAAWIYSTNAATAGQRILTDDAAGTTGYGFSLGDGASGKLRFFSRGVVPVILDSTYSISSNTWYFVAAVADITNRTRTIYVFSSAGALLASTSIAHTGTWGTDAGAVQIGTSQSGYYFKGYIDEAQVYPRALSQSALTALATQTHVCPTAVGPDHFQLSHGGTGITCTATAVTLAAHSNDHSVFSTYTGTVTLGSSVGRGDWTLVTGSGTLSNGAANDGAATYGFTASDNGSVTLGFQDTTAETLSLTAADGSVTEASGNAVAATDDPSITFSTSGFEFQANSVVNAIGTQIAGKSSATAPGAQTLQIRAIKTSDSSTACVAALQGSKTVQFGYECVSPATCSASTLSVNGGSSTAIAANAAGSVSAYTNASMTFDNAGKASFSINWNDAGSTRLYARYALPVAGGAASGSYMAGSSNTFVSRPFAYALSITGNPAASSASGTKFITAGTTFNASARAVAWSSAADANNDGIADGMESSDTSATNNASLAGNATTPNFAPATSLTLTSNLILPAGGAHPGITGSASAVFSNGVAAISGMRYDEVGIIEISAAQGGSYLGLSTTETAKIRGSSGYVGRFYPKRFSVAANAPLFTNRCSAGAFTYQDQPFYFTTAPVLGVTALSAQGGTTSNYTTTDFFKLSSTLSGRSYVSAASGAHPLTVVNASVATLAGSTGGTGTATLSLVSGSSGDAFTYTRDAPEAPFAASVTANYTAADLTDSDGVCLDAANDGSCDTYSITPISGANLRYGRLVTDNSMGSELGPLGLPLYTQYYNGSGFMLNTADACSTLSTAALDFGAGTPAGLPAAGVMSVGIGGGTSTGTFSATTASGGRFGLSLSAPGAGNTGEISWQVNLGTAAAPWLQYDWDGNGTRTDDPSARATFGTFQGPKRIVFKREVW
jgi:MSHA biogenesis protein MshQ